jgi:hypothetical protein
MLFSYFYDCSIIRRVLLLAKVLKMSTQVERVCKYEFQQSTAESAFQHDVASISKTEPY